MEKKSPNDYIFGKVIGEGSFSTVYLAKEVTSKREFAIKVCEKSTIIRENKQEYVRREKSALHLLNNSPGIISLTYTFQDPRRLYFVLTYAAKGELLKYIHRTGFSLECAKFYSAELLLAIEEMHKKNIIHRDLKPENLLLSRDMHLMIADFGSSKILPEDYDYDKMQQEIEQMREEIAAYEDGEGGGGSSSRPSRRKASFVGTAQFVSPEILKGNAASLATDLWSYGCIIYQMLAGMTPFKGATEYLIFQKILNGEYDFPDDFTDDAKDLIQKLLVFNPKERLGADDSKENCYQSIRNHQFFKGINWYENLYRMKPPDMKMPNNGSTDDDDDFLLDDDVRPGLGDEQLSRILQREFGSGVSSNLNLEEAQQPSVSSLEAMLEDQRINNEWADFVESSELILRYGFVNKRKKGPYITRKRMLVLTAKPRLIYIDPFSKVMKGEIPFDSHLTCETKNFRSFSLHTPNRTYYLEDPLSEADRWCEAIEEAKEKYIKMS